MSNDLKETQTLVHSLAAENVRLVAENSELRGALRQTLHQLELLHKAIRMTLWPRTPTPPLEGNPDESTKPVR